MIVTMETSVKEVLLREVFTTALRTVSTFPVFQIAVTDEKNRRGVGECVATPAIVGDNFDSFQEIFDAQVRKLLLNGKIDEIGNLDIWPSLKSAVDCAIHQLEFKESSVSVKTDVTVPIAEIAELSAIVKNRINAGFTTLKVKLGKEPAQLSCEKLAAIIDASDGKATLRIDPNQAWTLAEALEFIAEVERLKISLEYIEQPLPAHDISGMKALRESTPFKIMADESCFNLDDAKRLIDHEACDLINIKLLKAGGIRQAELIAQECLDSGMKFSVGSMMESEEGVRAAIHFAYKYAPEITHDLDAAWWIKGCSMKYEGGRVWS